MFGTFRRVSGRLCFPKETFLVSSLSGEMAAIGFALSSDALGPAANSSERLGSKSSVASVFGSALHSS